KAEDFQGFGQAGGKVQLKNTVKVRGNDPSNRPIEAEDSELVNLELDEFKIPNVFTPNNDGENDFFEILGINRFDRVEIIVYNRWGNEVFRSGNYRNNWSGQNLNEGTYYYLIYTYKGAEKKAYSGWVLLKRN